MATVNKFNFGGEWFDVDPEEFQNLALQPGMTQEKLAAYYREKNARHDVSALSPDNAETAIREGAWKQVNAPFEAAVKAGGAVGQFAGEHPIISSAIPGMGALSAGGQVAAGIDAPGHIASPEARTAASRSLGQNIGEQVTPLNIALSALGPLAKAAPALAPFAELAGTAIGGQMYGQGLESTYKAAEQGDWPGVGAGVGQSLLGVACGLMPFAAKGPTVDPVHSQFMDEVVVPPMNEPAQLNLPLDNKPVTPPIEEFPRSLEEGRMYSEALDKMPEEQMAAAPAKPPVPMTHEDIQHQRAVNIVSDHWEKAIKPALQNIRQDIDLSGVSIKGAPPGTTSRYSFKDKAIYIDLWQMDRLYKLDGSPTKATLRWVEKRDPLFPKTRDAYIANLVNHELSHIGFEETQTAGTRANFPGEYGGGRIATFTGPGHNTGGLPTELLPDITDIAPEQVEGTRGVDLGGGKTAIVPAEDLIHAGANIEPRSHYGPNENEFYGNMSMAMHNPEMITAVGNMMKDFQDPTLWSPEQAAPAEPTLGSEMVSGAAEKPPLLPGIEEAKNNMEAMKRELIPEQPPAPPTWKEFVEQNKTAGKKPKQLKLEFEALQKGGPPSILKKGPKLPEVPPEVFNNLSAWRRATTGMIKAFGKVNPKLGEMAKGYADDWAQLSGDFIASYKEITKDLSKADKESVRLILEGENPTSVAENVTTAASRLRNLLGVSYDLSKGAGLEDLQFRTNYFPHVFEPGKGPLKGIGNTRWAETGTGGGPKPFEMAREANRQDYIKDLDVLEHYFDQSSRRIAESKHFGPEHEKLSGLLGGAKFDEYTANYIKKSVKTLTGRQEPAGQLAQWGRKARHLQALSDLGLAAPLQIGQSTNTAAYGGVFRSMEAVAHLAKKGNYEIQMLKAMRSGALKPDLMMEIVGRTGDDLPVFRRPELQKFMYGVGTLDKAMRVHAYTVGEMIGNDIKAGNKSAMQLARDLGLDPAKASPAEIGRVLSDKGQFKTGPGELPRWASTEYGKMIFQYKNFAYQYTKFARGMIQDAFKGNVKPLARFLAVGAPFMGEAVNDIRAAIKHINSPMQAVAPTEKETPWDDRRWEENLHAAFQNRRIPLTHPYWRLVQNILSVGGLGILQPYMESLAGPDTSLTKAIGGPVAGTVEDFFAGAKEGKLGKTLLQQIPIWGYDLANYAYPRKKAGRGQRTGR